MMTVFVSDYRKTIDMNVVSYDKIIYSHWRYEYVIFVLAMYHYRR